MLAVIVAGGLGTRARQMTGDETPKALLLIGGTPIIERQMTSLVANGVDRLIILAGHLGDVIESYLLAHPPPNGLEVTVRIEGDRLGTAGAVIDARTMIDEEDFLVIFGDLLFNYDFSTLITQHRNTNAAGTIVCRPNDHPATSDLVEIDEHSKIARLLSRKSRLLGDYRNLVPTGIYMLRRDDLYAFPKGEILDFFQDYFPALLSRGDSLYACRSTSYIADIGTVAGRDAAERDLLSGRFDNLSPDKARPAIFFDIDGVLNEEIPGHGILSPDLVRLIPGVAKALCGVNRSGFFAVGVTNRPQVAKGLLTYERLNSIFGRLEQKLAIEGAAFLDRIYFCPHHPEVGFAGEVPNLKIDCNCRKPKSGLLFQAFNELPIDRVRSSMIGDSWRDIVASNAAGIYAYGVRTGYGVRDSQFGTRADLMFSDASEAIAFCLSYEDLVKPLIKPIEMLCDRSDRVLIGICGQSGSGKSLIAHALERVWLEQGLPVLRVRLDDWLLPLEERNGHDVYGRARAGEYGEVFLALREGKPVNAPGYNAYTRGPSCSVNYISSKHSLVLIEGVMACSNPGRAHLDLAIFVDSSKAKISSRQLALLKWKGINGEELVNTLRERIDDEAILIEQQREVVDIIFSPRELSI